MAKSKIDVRRIAGTLGGVIDGVDLSKELDSEAVEQIRRAFHEHLVIFFRGQDLLPEKYLAFWDNRASQHNPVDDYHGYKRILHRITLAGDTPM